MERVEKQMNGQPDVTPTPPDVPVPGPEKIDPQPPDFPVPKPGDLPDFPVPKPEPPPPPDLPPVYTGASSDCFDLAHRVQLHH